jgi:hypothetical protein
LLKDSGIRESLEVQFAIYEDLVQDIEIYNNWVEKNQTIHSSQSALQKKPHIPKIKPLSYENLSEAEAPKYIFYRDAETPAQSLQDHDSSSL